MARIFLGLFAFVLLYGIFVTPAHAATFFDDFNDENADGWWLGNSLASPSVFGNWRIEDGMLIQDIGADGVIALVENNQYASQTLETRLKTNGPGGYGGFVLWYIDLNNYVLVNFYPVGQYFSIDDKSNGVGTATFYPFLTAQNDTWYNLKVQANSFNGDLKIYLDGNYLFTHTVTTPSRLGQSGLMNGNAGAYFDEFSLTNYTTPGSKDECKNSGWMGLVDSDGNFFKNQGNCVRFVASLPQL